MIEMKSVLRWTGILSLTFILGLSARTDADAAFSTAVAGYSQGSVNTGPMQSLGFDFKANSAITVNELGAYEASATSISQGQVVYLYDITKGAVVTSTALNGGFTVGNFNYASVAPVTLNTTDVYTIYTTYAASATQYGQANTLTFSNDITIVPIGGDNTGFGSGTTGAPLNQGFAYILAVDFQYSPQVVPEPASMAMVGMGAVAVGGLMIRRRRKTN